jgi:ATP-dependent DNA ligase
MRLINKLAKANGRLEKEEILSRATELEKKVLYYAYNPYMNYGISNVVPTEELGDANEGIFYLLDKLANRKITGSAARKELQHYAEIYGHLIYLICRKNLNCGISVKTINKVFPRFIPEFNVQLAKEVPLVNLRYPVLAQIKYDGVRVIAIINATDKTCSLLTRNGKTINCPNLVELLLSKVKDNIVLDGEITIANGKMADRTSISGRVNSAIHGGILEVNDICYNVFDCMTINEFNTATCNHNYFARLTNLKFYTTKIDNKLVKFVESIEIHNAENGNNYYTKVLSKGYEGLILKSSIHRYTFKRSKDWVKVKAIRSADLVCIQSLHGKQGTKYENCIGSLHCCGVINGKEIAVNVGSGLSDTQRKFDNSYFDGKTIEVKYNDIIRNANNNGWTLFLPRFIAIRFDK